MWIPFYLFLNRGRPGEYVGRTVRRTYREDDDSLKEYTGRVVNYDAKNKLEYLIDFGKEYKRREKEEKNKRAISVVVVVMG